MSTPLQRGISAANGISALAAALTSRGPIATTGLTPLDRARRANRLPQGAVEAGYILLQTDDPPLSLKVLLGDGSPNINGGVGGWAEVPRPRRVGLTQWAGISPYRLDVPIMFDGYVQGRSVEQDIRTLELMAIPSGGRTEPPVIVITGAVPHSDLHWVVESIDWGDALREGGPDRLRQAATIHFLHLESSDAVIVVSSAARHRSKSKRSKPRGARSKTYRVKRGDTLRTIAAHQLGDATRWDEIAKLNKIRDPDRITVGQTLKLP